MQKVKQYLFPFQTQHVNDWGLLTLLDIAAQEMLSDGSCESKHISFSYLMKEHLFRAESVKRTICSVDELDHF